MFEEIRESSVFEDVDPKAIEKIFYEFLIGVMEKWDLSVGDISSILHRPESTVYGWLSDKRVPFKKDANFYQLLEFMELYDSISSLFFTEIDQKNWLRKQKAFFGNLSPIEILSKDSRYLLQFRNWVDSIANP